MMTPKPTTALSNMPVETGDTVQETFAGISISFVGANEMNFREVTIFETITEEWFTEYYAERQQSASIDITDLTTRITVMDQIVTIDDDNISNNRIVYDQTLSYDALPGAQTAENYITLPYLNGEENRNYVARLVSNLDAFPADTVPSTVSRPIIPSAEDAQEVDDSSGDSSIGIIVGVCVAIIALLMLAFGFRWYQKRSAARPPQQQQPSLSSVSSALPVTEEPEPAEREPAPINTVVAQEIVAASDSIVFAEDVIPVRDTEQQQPQSQTDKAELPRFKDQAQTAVPPASPTRRSQADPPAEHSA